MSPCARFQIAAIACLVAGASFAQGGPLGADRAVPPTPTPVGSGARAAGMANAFVAIADDATAASWNPAGLVQLERPEFSIVADYLSTRDDFTSTTQPELNGTHSFDDASLNFLSFVYPIPRPVLGRNVVLSLSYQKRYDFTRQFDGQVVSAQAAPGGLILGQDTRLDFEQSGGLGALSPSVAFELTNTLSLGVSLNLWRSALIGQDGWEQTTRVNSLFTAGPSLSLSRGFSREKYDDIRGESVTLGALWQAAPRWTLGLRYDSALKAKAHYESTDSDLRLVPNIARPIVTNISNMDETRRLRFPATLSLGAAYRRNDRLTLSADVSRTNWNDVYVQTGAGKRFSLIDGADLGNPLRRTKLDPAYAVRLGAEYAFIPKQRGETLNLLWTLRGGVFMEQEPASGRNTRNLLSPGNGKPDDFYGATVGLGLLVRQRINIDAAYQYRFGNGVNGDLNPGVAGFHADEDSHRFVLSTVIYF
jgi:long-subunit fatty acid transport protein